MNNKCKTELNPHGHNVSPVNCPASYVCCTQCKNRCNMRCEYLDKEEKENARENPNAGQADS